MTDFNLNNIVSLLKEASSSGIKISYNDERLLMEMTEDNYVDDDLLFRLKDSKTHLIEFFRQHQSESTAAQVISTFDRNTVLRIPLSHNQERLWFIDQLEGSLAYHVPAVLRLRGTLDIAALGISLKQIITRHEVLRTVINVHDGQAYQYIQEADGWELQQASFDGDDTALQHYVSSLISDPFDLSSDYMLRCHLLKAGTDEHLLVIILHHIASDGWSAGIIVRELITLYAASIAGTPDSLPPLPVQYADYALWQRSHMNGEGLSTHLSYWRRQLSDVPVLLLPADYTRPVVQSSRGATRGFEISGKILSGLQALSKEQGTTLFMTLLSAFKVLLYRYSGQEDISVGTPIAGRSYQETEGLVGFFVNTLVLRSDLSGNPSFLSLLQRVKQTTLSAYDHQEVPFEQVVSAVVKERALSHNPLFQVMFVLQNTPAAPELELGGLHIEQENLIPPTSQFDQIWSLEEAAGVLRVGVTYCTDLFAASTIRHMQDHFVQLLSSVLSAPDLPVGDLPLLTSAEQLLLQPGLHYTAQHYPADKTIVDLFEAQVLRTPPAIAVEYEGSYLTYETLSAEADKLAGHLQANGVLPETLVAICMDRSLDMIIGILGILKAGGAYVPIDPLSPPERIAWILEDSRTELCVSNSRVAAVLEGIAGIEIVLTDQTTYNGVAAKTTLHPDNLAYVIYTSGSSGRSKGVLVEHGSVVNLVSTHGSYFGLDATDRIALCSNYYFDASVEQLFGALLTGATLVMVPADVQSDPQLFEAFLSTAGITHLEATYSFLSRITPLPYAGLRRVVSGGEACHGLLASQWSGVAAFYNIYGPTEATVSATVYQYNETAERTTDILPIGRPLANVSLYILDSNGQPVPPGAYGELHIGGRGVSRGYLNQPALTAEKYIHSLYKEERLYRTGDLVRLQADGNLVYAGRIDMQVKIRGYRIEPGEIEQLLQQHDQVKSAVVVAQEDTRLVAYIVSDGDPDTGALRSYLKSQLPEYMVPAYFMVLPFLPVTGNGKIDLSALPEIDTSQSGVGYVAPRNSQEEALCDVWRILLNVARVGVHDNFFVLGGHSLLAMRVQAAIRTRLHTEVSVKAIFAHATVSELSSYISQENAEQPLPAVTAQERPALIPLSYNQERLWFIDQLEGSVAYHMPGVLRLRGKPDTGALVASLKQILIRHEVLRTVIKVHDGQAYQHIQPADDWELQQSTFHGDDAQLQSYISSLVSHPFDLSKDYMLRCHLLKTGADEYLLVITLHHVASDGWSIGIIVKELIDLYAAAIAGVKPALPPLPVQYADYALWQRAYISGAWLATHLSYWQQQLSDVPVLALPADYARPAVQSSHGTALDFEIAAPLVAGLQALSKEQGTTLFMTLLSVFKVLLYRYSGQEDICVGAPVAGRTRQETEGLAGFFVNTLVLRSDLSGNPSFLSLLQQVKQTTLSAYDHQEVPFEQVVSAVVKERELSHNPLFQVMFVLHNIPAAPELQLGGLHIEQTDRIPSTSQFDQTWSLEESPGGLSVRVTYCTDLFADSTIRRMQDHFVQLLASVVSAPDMPVGHLPLLSSAEQISLQSGLHYISADYPQEETLLDLFDAQVLRTPSAIAVAYEDSHLTYAALSAKADELAGYLQANGVYSDTLVAVCIDRSLDMIVSILGVLKVGGAYVPIDPLYPQERIAWMLENTGAAICISSSRVAAVLEGITGIQVVLADQLKYDGVIEKISVQPENLAYVIYTSGSTGKPKGVMIEHRSLYNFLRSMQTILGVDETSSMLAITTYCFDIAYLEFYLPLIAGGKVIIVDRETATDGFLLSALLAEKRPVFMQATPSTWQMLMEAGWENKEGVTILTGGEAIKEVLKNKLVSLSDKKVWNMYGPTEATIWAAVKALVYEEKVTIGTPIHNTRCYIIDANRQLVPVGVAGELCISGIQVARGYLGRPELNREKFIDHPFEPGEKLYLTGDVARWLSDGNVECMGRKDDQVKIRGYRIEPGEIESVLTTCGLVNQAVVVPQTDHHGNSRLIGYVVPAGAYDREEILARLKTRLPDHMIPAVLIEMDKLPLLPSGKINKKALPAPDAKDLQTTVYTAPRNETEQYLAHVWEDLLGITSAGIYDNFFSLGGNSLLAMRVIAAIRGHLNTEVGVKALFLYPTIAQLAIHLDGQESGLPLSSIIAGERPAHIPLSYSQRYLWLIDRQYGTAHYHMPGVWRLTGQPDYAALESALRKLPERHEILRTVIVEEDGMAYQKIIDIDNWKLNIIQGEAFADDPVALEEYLTSLFYQPFDLSAAYVFRAYLIYLSPQEHVLMTVTHHIASDGWSAGILMRELLAYYNAYVTGNTAQVETLKIQYGDYAIWQRQHLSEPEQGNKLAYWKRKLTGAVMLDLPTDHERTGKLPVSAGFTQLYIDKDTTARLEELSQQQGATLFMTLLAAFKIVMCHYSGQTDICIGSVIAGRNRLETENLIGFFVNLLVLRSDLSGNPVFAALLQQVKNTTMEAYTYQDIPLELIANELTGNFDPAVNPFFRTVFALENVPAEPVLSLESLSARMVAIPHLTTPFELSVSISVVPEGMRIDTAYSNELYKEETINFLLQTYAGVLKSIAHQPDQHIDNCLKNTISSSVAN
jgi:amino acid adenylation domain-containing protein